jgi:hypothetical protein
VIDDESTAA